MVLGIEHKYDALREMLTELEEYRPQPQRAYLKHLRNVFYKPGGYHDYVGQATGDADGAGAVSPSDNHAGMVSDEADHQELAHVNNRHRIRELVSSSHDISLIKLFNETVRNVFYFRYVAWTYCWTKDSRNENCVLQERGIEKNFQEQERRIDLQQKGWKDCIISNDLVMTMEWLQSHSRAVCRRVYCPLYGT